MCKGRGFRYSMVYYKTVAHRFFATTIALLLLAS